MEPNLIPGTCLIFQEILKQIPQYLSGINAYRWVGRGSRIDIIMLDLTSGKRIYHHVHLYDWTSAADKDIFVKETANEIIKKVLTSDETDKENR